MLMHSNAAEVERGSGDHELRSSSEETEVKLMEASFRIVTYYCGFVQFGQTLTPLTSPASDFDCTV